MFPVSMATSSIPEYRYAARTAWPTASYCCVTGNCVWSYSLPLAPALDHLDLLGQQRVAGTTRRLLKLFLAPAWSQTEPMLAHARLFFSDFAADGNSEESCLVNELKVMDSSLRDYYCYVLLDFVAVDRDLVDTSLASALVLSKRLGFVERFTELAQKELGISKRQFGKIERDAEGIVARAANK